MSSVRRAGPRRPHRQRRDRHPHLDLQVAAILTEGNSGNDAICLLEPRRKHGLRAHGRSSPAEAARRRSGTAAP